MYLVRVSFYKSYWDVLQGSGLLHINAGMSFVNTLGLKSDLHGMATVGRFNAHADVRISQKLRKMDPVRSLNLPGASLTFLK